MILLFYLSRYLLIIFNNLDDPTLQYTDDGKMIFEILIIGNDPSSISNECISFCNERYMPDHE